MMGARHGTCRSSAPAVTYPGNPNGLPDSITGLTTANGRFTIMMSHPERIFCTMLISCARTVLAMIAPV